MVQVELCRHCPGAVLAITIIRHAQDGLFSGLKAADDLRYDGAWPPLAERVLPFRHGLIGARGRSCTESSRTVKIPLRGDDW